MLVNVVDDDNQYPWINILASIAAWASSVVNPFIYAASNRSYRVAYYKLFSTMKFWGQPLSPMISKSFVPSKGSKDSSQNIGSNPSANGSGCCGGCGVGQATITTVNEQNSKIQLQNKFPPVCVKLVIEHCLLTGDKKNSGE